MENKAEPIKKTVSKVVFDGRTKIVAFVVSALLILAGILVMVFLVKKEIHTEEDTLYSYELTADSEYKVYLTENNIYEAEWLEEGRMYARKLTDHIELLIKLSLTGTGTVTPSIEGSYQLNAVLEGYYTEENEKKTIYEKKFPLKEGELTQDESGNINLEEPLSISLEEYAGYLVEIEETLGGSTDKNFYVELSGKVVINAPDETQEKEFSYKLAIPVEPGSSFYSINKPEAFKESGSMSESRSVAVAPALYKRVLGFGLTALGALLCLFTIFATKSPSEDEKWIIKMRRLLRKYGSRLVYVESIEESGSVCKVKDMSSLLAISEELHQPVLCCLDEDELPEDGKFIIQDGDKLFLLHFERNKSDDLDEIGETDIEAEEYIENEGYIESEEYIEAEEYTEEDVEEEANEENPDSN